MYSVYVVTKMLLKRPILDMTHYACRLYAVQVYIHICMYMHYIQCMYDLCMYYS